MDPSRNPPPPGGGSGHHDRRPSDAESARQSIVSSNDDEYDLMVNAVSDGFRPANPNTSPPAARRRPPPPPPTALQPPPMAVSPATSKLSHRPSSTAKAPRSHDSLTIRADGSSTNNNNPPANDNHRGNAPQLRIESPYHGPSDPSHPYQMYPQRTLSNATDSTAAQEGRGSFGAANNAAPQQYNLFGQSTVLPAANAQQPIPVGFTGLGTNYQRRVGPDGEEAGELIGPLGHTEELPPYTRYPEVAFTSKPGANSQASTEAAQTQNTDTPTESAQNAGPIQQAQADPEEAPSASEQAAPLIDGAGGIGIATRNPEFASTQDTLMPSRSRGSRLSTRSYASSYHDINTAARDFAEKPTQTKWQRRARKKLWGVVPYWSICLVACGMVLMGIVMGAVVGSVLTKGKTHTKGDKKGPWPEKPPPTPTAIDIQPLDTFPTGLPGLTVGPYSIPQLEISQSRKFCFNDTKQAQAWSCKMPFRYYNMNITEDPFRRDIERYNLTLTGINKSDPLYIMGTQPPNIPEPVPLQLVNDTFETGRGPAWWVRVSYNKTVIVDEDLFQAETANSKRSWVYTGPPVADLDPPRLDPSRFSRKGVSVSDGECPWVCTWPDTTLEIFIYPQQNVSVPTSSNAPSPTAMTDDDDDAYFNFKPLSPYPQVVKLLERRQPGCGTATCRKVKIMKHGQQAKVVHDENGQAIEVTINENVDPQQAQYEDHLRWSRDGRRVDDRSVALQRRESLELTPCGCLWLST